MDTYGISAVFSYGISTMVYQIRYEYAEMIWNAMCRCYMSLLQSCLFALADIMQTWYGPDSSVCGYERLAKLPAILHTMQHACCCHSRVRFWYPSPCWTQWDVDTYIHIQLENSCLYDAYQKLTNEVMLPIACCLPLSAGICWLID
jgi:hypothetical protein